MSTADSRQSETGQVTPARFLLGLAGQVRLHLAIAVAAGLTAGILVALQARLLAGVISRVFVTGSGMRQNQAAIVALIGVILLRAGAIYLSEIAGRSASRKVKSGLRFELLNRLSDPIRLRLEHTGELAVVIHDGIEALDVYFSQYLPQAALAGLVPVVILSSIFPLDSLSAWILLFTGPLIPVFMLLIGKAAEEKTRKKWSALSILGAHFLDTLQGLATLKALGRSVQEGRALEASGERYRLAAMDVLRVTFLSALALEWLGTISTAILAVQIGLRLLAGGIRLEQALIVLILAPEFYLPLRTLSLRFHAAQAGISAAGRILELLANNPPRPLSGAALPLPMTPGGLLPTIHFDQVACHYPGETGLVLQEVSFSLAPGSHTVLIGSSGAGKSTIMQLLLGFIQPSSGKIWVGDLPLERIDLEAWRASCAWVPEKPHLFHTSIASNIALGRSGASPGQIQTAARLAGLDDWVETLPEGYATVVGEKGVRLSSGQAQRLALARAFLKDAPLLLMDEPANALDPELADQLSAAIQELASRRTVLTIAHRLSTVRRADQIISVEAGKVVETGAPEDLAMGDGWYARFLAAAEQAAP